MAIAPTVLLFSPLDNPSAALQRRQLAVQLEVHGFVVVICEQARQLYQAVQQSAVQQGADRAATPLFVILKGASVDNQAAAAYLRTLHSCLGIIAAVRTLDETEVIQTLQSGADSYYLYNASIQLKIATLVALWRCYKATGTEVTVSQLPLGVTKWKLLDQAWILASPEGKFVTLTTGERAFLLTLFNAPQRHAAHTELLAAVDACSSCLGERTDTRRLGVLVSRMRRKFLGQGLKLPVQSVHSSGYMFTGEIE